MEHNKYSHFDAVGMRLRELFSFENEPLSWDLIDKIETLAETTIDSERRPSRTRRTIAE